MQMCLLILFPICLTSFTASVRPESVCMPHRRVFLWCTNHRVYFGLKLKSIHRHEPLSLTLQSERLSEQTNECSGSRKRREQCGASEWVSGASKWANVGVNGPVCHASILSILFYPMVGVSIHLFCFCFFVCFFLGGVFNGVHIR